MLTKNFKNWVFDDTVKVMIGWEAAEYTLHYAAKAYDPQPDGSRIFWRDGVPVKWGEGEMLVEGSIKWDGCSDLNIGEDGYLHLCNDSCYRQLDWALRTARETAAKNIKNWDAEIAGWDLV